MSEPKLVVFDCDGTLLDSQHMIFDAMHHAFESHQLPPPGRAAVRTIIGLSLEPAVAILAPDLERDQVAQVVRSYVTCFKHLRATCEDHEPLFPGAYEIITGLSKREGILIGLATGKSRRGVDFILGHHNLLDYFHVIQTADDAPSKPDPAMLRQAMSEAGTGPECTLMIGDSSYDMAMAKAADVRAIGVGWGYHSRADLQAAGADIILSEFSGLLDHL